MSEIPHWLKHTTVWLLLAVGVFLGVQAWMNNERATRFTVAGGTLELRRSADGHYHWPGTVAGRQVDYLVDTGATGTAIPAAMARELGLVVVGRMQSQTALAWPSAARCWPTCNCKAASAPNACA